MTNNHTRNQRKRADNAARRQTEEMEGTEGMENAWDEVPAWRVLVQEDGEVLGAQGGVGGNTADEGTAAGFVPEPEPEVAADLPPKKKRKPRTKKRGGAAEPPTEADADNQGPPGSVMATDDVEAGQGLQETWDAFYADPRVKRIQQQHRDELAALEKDGAARDAAAREHAASIKKLEDDLANYKDKLHNERIARSEDLKLNDQHKTSLQQEQERFQKYREKHEQAIKAASAITSDLADAKQSLAELASELKDAEADLGQVVAERDELVMEVDDLQAANERLQSEAAASRDLAATNAATNSRLDDSIAQVHADFEDAFFDMAKDLTMDEKFAYARDLQQKATLATRLASETLHDELEEHPEPETFSFSKITSVETVPVAAVAALPAVVLPAAAAPAAATRKPMTFSGISTVETAPFAAPIAAAPVDTKKKPMTLSGITSVETPPVAAAPAGTTKKPMSLSGITSVETVPVAATPAAVKEQPLAEVIEVTKIVNAPYDRFVDRFVDRAVVPWWMWLSLSLGLLMCVGGFAGLWREQQIWVAANDTAYQRLMGTSQETWLDWVIMGVKDLVLLPF
jgi:hypothetical protein